MRRIPFFDGLRAFAILSVMSFHGMGEISRRLLGNSGWLGVDDFFVVSGFLITTMLLSEERLSTRHFYIRRAFRILPALYVFILFVYFWYFIGGHYSALGSILIAVLGMTDLDIAYGWNLIRATGHLFMTWSLSVEEKFYLFFPWMVRKLEKKNLLQVLLVFIASIEGWKCYLILCDASKVRLSTPIDTKCDVILVGSIFALLWWEPKTQAILLRILGAKTTPYVVLVLLAWSISTIGDPSMLTNRASRMVFWLVQMPIHDILVAALIVALLCRDRSLLARLLAAKPVAWIGQISYSLYIWHVYVFGLVDNVVLPALRIPQQSLISEAIRIWLAFSVSSASYYLIEKPLRCKGYELCNRN